MTLRFLEKSMWPKSLWPHTFSEKLTKSCDMYILDFREDVHLM